MALVTLGRAFAHLAMASFAERMSDSVIFKAGLDLFEGRVLDTVTADALVMSQTSQVFSVAENHFAFRTWKNKQVLCRADRAGEDIIRCRQGNSRQDSGQQNGNGD
jgi:hypothetical protein